MAGEAAAVIGKSVQIRGEVKGNEDLLVDGLVEGTISLTDSRLTIGSHANVQANLTARDVVVLGTLVGDIQAAGRVELRAGCIMTGDIRAGRLSVEENAIFTGKVELTGGSSQASTGGGEKPVAAPMQASASTAPTGALFGAN
jgi:cytoskeletal protein CcmA (bactofilin family)